MRPRGGGGPGGFGGAATRVPAAALPIGGRMIDRDKIYIDGAWVPSTGQGTIDVVNATTEEVMGRIPEGTADDVDKAVAAAKAAFAGWSRTSVEERGKFLQRITEGLQARMGDIAQTISQEVGMPLNL